ncbi:forkhead box protein, partial [Chryseobacterium oranimense]|uniref:hypothetical protein n=1 Tax=Chryseobacterium oranimense TaxID=421058 RepID=UPI0005960598
MKKIEKLTPDQQLNLQEIKNKWLDKVFKYKLNKSGTFENALKQMKDLYSFCKLEAPIVLYLDSPMACQIAANILSANKESQVGSQV